MHLPESIALVFFIVAVVLIFATLFSSILCQNLLVPRTLLPRPPSSREGDRPQAVEGVLPQAVESVYALNPHSILTAYSGCNSFAPKPSIFQPTVEIWSSGSAVPALPAGLTITRGFAPLRLVTP